MLEMPPATKYQGKPWYIAENSLFLAAYESVFLPEMC